MKRLKYTGHSLSVFQPATEDQIDSIWSFMERIDSTVSRTDTTQAKIRSKKKLKDFLESHCKCRYVLFHGDPTTVLERFDGMHQIVTSESTFLFSVYFITSGYVLVSDRNSRISLKTLDWKARLTPFLFGPEPVSVLE